METNYVTLDELRLTTPTKHITDVLNLNNIREITIPDFYKKLALSGLAFLALVFVTEAFVAVVLPNALVFLDVIMPVVFRISLVYTIVSGSTAGILIIRLRKQKATYQCAIVKCQKIIVQEDLQSYEFSVKRGVSLICTSAEFATISSDIIEGEKYIIAKDTLTEQFSICNAEL